MDEDTLTAERIVDLFTRLPMERQATLLEWLARVHADQVTYTRS